MYTVPRCQRASDTLTIQKRFRVNIITARVRSLGGLRADKVRCISTTSILSMYKADVQILPVLQLGAMSGGKVSYPSLLTFNALRRGVGVGMRGDCT